MPLFTCSKCNTVENTACGHYWMQKAEGKPVLCSECGDGQWHGKFDKTPATGYLIDDHGFLWHPEIEKDIMPRGTIIVGTVNADGTIRPKDCDHEWRDFQDDSQKCAKCQEVR